MRSAPTPVRVPARIRRGLALAAGLAALTGLVGCAGTAGDTSASPEASASAIPEISGELTVYAAASLTAAFDEDPALLDWGPNGIWLWASQKTEAGLFRLDPATKAVTRVPFEGTPFAFGFSFDS